MKRTGPDARHQARRFIRHPARMPIHFDLQGRTDGRDEYLRNVGEGGLCFTTEEALRPGRSIRLTIPVFAERYQVEATVAWCRPAEAGFEVGVRFMTPQDRFCVRMVEQLCYIEDYRNQVEREEGRQMAREQAAEEWIERFAEVFPGLH